MTVVTNNLHEVFSILLLCIIFVANTQLRSLNSDRHVTPYFDLLVIFTGSTMLLELLSMSCDSRQGNLFFFLNAAFATAAFISGGVPSILLCLHTAKTLNATRRQFRALSIFSSVIFVAHASLAILSNRFGFYFTLTPENHFVVGYAWFISAVLSFIPFCVTLFIIVINKNNGDRRISITFLSATAFVFFAILLQGATGFIVIFPVGSLAILIIFIYINLNLIEIDYLTGLNNKRGFDSFIRHANSFLSRDMIACFSMDLNRFKQINDQFGHSAGNQALIEFSSILKASFRKADFLARTGGDEFIVIVKIKADSEAIAIKQRFENAIATFNARREYPWTISVALGLRIRKTDEQSSVYAIVNESDALMYANKNGGQR